MSTGSGIIRLLANRTSKSSEPRVGIRGVPNGVTGSDGSGGLLRPPRFPDPYILLRDPVL